MHKSARHGQEILVAKSVNIPSTKGNINDLLLPALPIVLYLCLVSVDNLHKLCTILGILNAGLLSKFNSCKAIAICFQYQGSLANIGIRPTSHALRATSIVCCAVNVGFSADLIEDFKMVNGQKPQQDHETKNRTNKPFWICAALAYSP
jgi:hypothetical protein